MLEKTIDNTVIIKRGFSKVHNTPKTDLLYFIFISRATNSFSNGIKRKKFCIYVDTIRLL